MSVSANTRNVKSMSNLSDLPERYVVLLDGAGPAFKGDDAHLGRDIEFTAEAWYPALCKFFKRVENEFNLEVVIAGHPKGKHPHISPLFEGRKVYYGLTRELVMGCEFVITRQSAAVSFAIIYKKPVIIITSNQLQNNELTDLSIRCIAEELGQKIINIDEFDGKVAPYVTIDIHKYREYRKNTMGGQDRWEWEYMDDDEYCEYVKDKIPGGLEKVVDKDNYLTCVKCGRTFLEYDATWIVDFDRKITEGPFCGCHGTSVKVKN